MSTNVQLNRKEKNKQYMVKTYPPRQLNKVILPDNFIKKMRRLASRPLVVLSSPPGFGKTTLLANQRKELIKERNQVFWLTLTEQEATIEQFLDSIVQCIQTETSMSNSQCVSFVSEVNQNPTRLFQYLKKLLVEEYGNRCELVFIFDDIQQIEDTESGSLLRNALCIAPENIEVFLSGQIKDTNSFVHPNIANETIFIDKHDLKLSAKQIQDHLVDAFDIEKPIETYSYCYTQSEGWPLGAQFYFDLVKNDREFERETANSTPKPVLFFNGLKKSEIANSIKPILSPSQISITTLALLFKDFDATIISIMGDGICSDQILREIAITTNIFEEVPNKPRNYRLTHFGIDFSTASSPIFFTDDTYRKADQLAQFFLDQNQYESALHLLLSIKDFKKSTLVLEEIAEEMIESGNTQKFINYFEIVFRENTTASPKLISIAMMAYATSFQKDKFFDLKRKFHHNFDQFNPQINETYIEELEELFHPVTATDQMYKRAPKRLLPSNALEHDLTSYIQHWQFYISENFEAARSTKQKRTHYFSSYTTLIEALSWYEQGFIDKSNQIFSTLKLTENSDVHLYVYSLVMQEFISGLKKDYLSVHLNLLPRWVEINASSIPPVLGAAYKARARSLVYEGKQEDALELLEQGIFNAQQKAFPCVEASLMLEKINVLSLLNETLYAQQDLKTLIEITSFKPSKPLVCLNGNHPQNYALLAFLRTYQLERDDAKIVAYFDKFNIDQKSIASKTLSTQLNLFHCHSLLRTAEIKKAYKKLAPTLKWLCREKLTQWLIYEPSCLHRYIEDSFEDWRLIKGATQHSSIANKNEMHSSADHYIFENLSSLTPREAEVLEYLVAGHDNKTISKAISVSVATIKWHIKNVYQKLGIQRREHLISVLSKTNLKEKH